MEFLSLFLLPGESQPANENCRKTKVLHTLRPAQLIIKSAKRSHLSSSNNGEHRAKYLYYNITFKIRQRRRGEKSDQLLTFVAATQFYAIFGQKLFGLHPLRVINSLMLSCLLLRCAQHNMDCTASHLVRSLCVYVSERRMSNCSTSTNGILVVSLGQRFFNSLAFGFFL